MKRVTRAIVAVCAMLCGSAAAYGQSSAELLQKRLAEIAASFPGKVGVFVRNVETGVETGVNADEQFPMASTYKVAIMAQVFREAEAGRIKLDERVTLTAADARLG